LSSGPFDPVPGLDDLFLRVEKPARYIGCELNSVTKDPRAARVRWALAFPDLYEVGMSNVGLRTLYHLLNDRPDTACERVFMPAPDLEAALRARGLPLFSLENRLPVRFFDILGFSLQFELCGPTVLAMLDLAGIPLFSRERRRDDPLVLGGGPVAYNPEPLADFFDAFAVGEGEELVGEIGEVVARWKPGGESREDLLWRLSELEGVYVPSHLRPRWNADGTFAAMEPLRPDRDTVTRRVVPDLDAAPMPLAPILPYIQTIHDRLPVEIQRGCTRGCRFCQAGMLARPVRQRSPGSARRIAEAGLASTGHDEVGFLSLSAGDYDCLNPMLEDFLDRFAPERVAVSLPSLRTETMNDRLAAQVRRVRKSGFTLAPEAATERLRRVINKGNKEENLLQAVESVFRSGWDLLKLYFMIGLPTETDDDVRAIVSLSARALDLARRHASHARIHVAVSTFVPKPFTPFQWEEMIPREETRRRHGLVLEELRRLPKKYRALDVRTHDADQSCLEGLLARGDRRVGTAVMGAFRRGQRLDGWTEHFRLHAWLEAVEDMRRAHGTDLAFHAQRARGEHERLPWEHVDCGVTRAYLWRARCKSREEAEIVDCVLGRCSACGACDYFTVEPRVYRAADYRPAPASRPAETPLNAGIRNTEPGPEGPGPGTAARGSPRGAETSSNGGIPDTKPGTEVPGPGTAARAAVPGPRTVVRIRYAKERRVRALSHLETKTMLERAIRRAQLPVAWTQGFSPRAKVSFGPALGTGIESRAEFLDVVLEGVQSADDVAARLARQFPPGFAVLGSEANPSAALNGAQTVVYEAHVPGVSRADLEAAVARAGALAEWSVDREKDGVTRRVDLRRAVRSMSVPDDGRLRFELLLAPEGGARPAEVVRALAGTDASTLAKESVRLEEGAPAHT